MGEYSFSNKKVEEWFHCFVLPTMQHDAYCGFSTFNPNNLSEEDVAEIREALKAELGRDYKVDPQWGGITRLDTASIGTDVPIEIDYAYRMRRIDSVVRDAQGRNVASLRPPRRPRPPLVTRLVGPAPAPFAKLRGNFRFHLQLYGTPGELLREAARRVLESKLKRPAAVQWIVDVDPLDSL